MESIKIALADDHQLFLKGIASLMGSISNTEVVIEASSGDQLIAMMGNTPVDLVLLDMQMPGKDGLETLSILQEKWPDTKVVFLTMHKEEALIIKCMENKAHGFLQKDAHPDEMELAVKRVIENGYYFSERVTQIMFKRLTKVQAKNAAQPIENPLTNREKEVLQLICQEKTTSEIADALHLSTRTIDGHRERLLQKTEARNSAGLVVYAAQQGWLKDWIAPTQ